MLARVKTSTDSQSAPRVLVNGKATDGLSALDRGLQYGDGLFETFRIREGVPEFWDRHIFRLARGCERLRLPAPPLEQLTDETRQLCDGRQAGVLKIIISRGRGGRGYALPEEVHPTRIVARFPAPTYPASHQQDGVVVRLCDTRLGMNPALAGLKHLNRLEQVLARAEWQDPTIAEGLMCDTEGRVVEGTMSNVFAVRDGRLLTPDLSRCGVAGILREVVLELAAKLGIPTQEGSLEIEDLMSSQEVFLTNSLIGIWPVRRIAERDVALGPVTQRLAAALEAEHGE